MKAMFDPLERLEAIIREEFEVLLHGDFQRLGALLCEKSALMENLQGQELDQKQLRRCRRLNRELLSGLNEPTQPNKYSAENHRQ